MRRDGVLAIPYAFEMVSFWEGENINNDNNNNDNDNNNKDDNDYDDNIH